MKLGVHIGIFCIAFLLTMNVTLAFAADSWQQKTSMPLPRAGIGVAQVDENIYAIGGWNQPPTNTTQIYNIAKGTWTLGASMPTARMLLGTAVYNGTIYAIGGKVNSATATNATEAYDPATGNWTKKAALPLAGFSFSAKVVGDKIYVIGGLQQVNSTTVRMLNATQVYDPATNTWSAGAAIPQPVFNYASAGADGKIYIISGNTLTPNGTAVDCNLTQIYNPQTDVWTTGAAVPVAVNAAAALTLANGTPQEIYVLGGGSNQLRTTYNITQIYNPQQDTWTNGPTLPACRFTLGTCVANQTLYILGGADNMTAKADVYALALGTQVPEFPPAAVFVLVIAVPLAAAVLVVRYKKR